VIFSCPSRLSLSGLRTEFWTKPRVAFQTINPSGKEAEIIPMKLDLNLASNLFGKISDTIQARLQRYADNPTEDGWDDVHGIILNKESMMTVWQALLELDPSFPRRGPSEDGEGRRIAGWERIPTSEEFNQAIHFATH